MTPEQLEKIRKLCDKNFKVGTHPKTICIDEMIYLGGCAGGMLDLIDQQADEIKQANHRYADLQNVCDDQDKEIKRLEDALVEERLSRNSKNRACLDEYGPEYDTEEFAREQLRAEGVIR